jgi:hypothetical protein
LHKEIKLYQDFSGKSFGLSGLDGHGQRPQFVFHKGQFISPTDFQDLQASLKTLE